MDSPGKCSSNRLSCAVCKHQRKKCTENCLMAPYFPAERHQDFEAVHKVFGVANISKMLKSLDVSQREEAVKSFTWEASMWRADPVFGPLGQFKKQRAEIESLRKQLEQQRFSSVANGPDLAGRNQWNPKFEIFPNFEGAMNAPYANLYQEGMGGQCSPYPGGFPDVCAGGFQGVESGRQGRVPCQPMIGPKPSPQPLMPTRRSPGCLACHDVPLSQVEQRAFREIPPNRIAQNTGDYREASLETVAFEGGGRLQAGQPPVASNMWQERATTNQPRNSFPATPMVDPRFRYDNAPHLDHNLRGTAPGLSRVLDTTYTEQDPNELRSRWNTQSASERLPHSSAEQKKN